MRQLCRQARCSFHHQRPSHDPSKPHATGRCRLIFSLPSLSFPCPRIRASQPLLLMELWCLSRQGSLGLRETTRRKRGRKVGPTMPRRQDNSEQFVTKHTSLAEPLDRGEDNPSLGRVEWGGGGGRDAPFSREKGIKQVRSAARNPTARTYIKKMESNFSSPCEIGPACSAGGDRFHDSPVTFRSAALCSTRLPPGSPPP